jgi:hypothetical protein
MDGIRDYMPEQNLAPLSKAILRLQDESDNESNPPDYSLALFKFQDAVNTILRRHNIKPHWMFALDSLIRNAVQQAVNVLSPENGVQMEADNGLEFAFEDKPANVAISNNGGHRHMLTASPVIPGEVGGLHLVVQNFIKNVAFELENLHLSSNLDKNRY